MPNSVCNCAADLRIAVSSETIRAVCRKREIVSRRPSRSSWALAIRIDARVSNVAGTARWGFDLPSSKR